MANKLKYRQDFTVTINNAEYKLTCYYQNTRTGFRHLCFFTYICEDDKPNTNAYMGKCVYYNRTWESYPYETVLREAVNKIIMRQINYNIDLAMDTVRRVN